MADLGRLAGQGVVYMAFAAFVGYFSTGPAYRPLPEDHGLLRLSFNQPGKPIGECRTRSAEELARLPAQMRTPQECPRERSPVVVRIEIDGAEVLRESFRPAGLRRDGAASGYWRTPLAAGSYRLRVQFNDDVRREGFTHERQTVVDVLPGQVVLVDFAGDGGGILIR